MKVSLDTVRELGCAFISALVFAGTNFFLTATSLIRFISLMGISARSSLSFVPILMDNTKAMSQEDS